MKLLTVGVPCYNSQDYMEKCVDSLLAGGERVEIVIVDAAPRTAPARSRTPTPRYTPRSSRSSIRKTAATARASTRACAMPRKYFKTVDSDDWVQDFSRFLDTLEEIDRQGGVDLFVTNYYYEHADGKGNRSINFSNALPEDRIFTWAETRPFRVDQILMIHACTFRTPLRAVCLPGEGGRRVVRLMYKLAQAVVRFN